MKTRDRILQTSLDMFNEYGEPNITTNHIAVEMDISPGNLYYHFRNKDEIIYLLFEHFEQQMNDILVVPEQRAPDMEDMWLYLHLIFETIWKYRFLYRDLNNLLSRNKKLKTHFKRILDRKIATAIAICEGLVETEVMQASRREIDALANNIVVIATYWLNFQSVHPPRNESNQLGRGAYQVISLVVPYLRGAERELLEQLSQVYLD